MWGTHRRGYSELPLRAKEGPTDGQRTERRASGTTAAGAVVCGGGLPCHIHYHRSWWLKATESYLTLWKIIGLGVGKRFLQDFRVQSCLSRLLTFTGPPLHLPFWFLRRLSTYGFSSKMLLFWDPQLDVLFKYLFFFFSPNKKGLGVDSLAISSDNRRNLEMIWLCRALRDNHKVEADLDYRDSSADRFRLVVPLKLAGKYGVLDGGQA